MSDLILALLHVRGQSYCIVDNTTVLRTNDSANIKLLI